MRFRTRRVELFARRVELFARRSGFGTRRLQSRTPRAAFLTRRMRSEPVTTTNPNLPPLLAARKLSPARANRRSRDCNPEYRTVRECRYGTGVPSFAYMGGPGREGFGPADSLTFLIGIADLAVCPPTPPGGRLPDSTS